MRLKPTPSIFATKLTKKVSKISKELRYKLIETKDVDFDTFIVLGNGDVDDNVIPIFCHHLNGIAVVGITKPEGKTRISVLTDFPTYISKLKISKIVLVMDQENDRIDTIYEQIERNLRNLNIRFSLAEDESRIRRYSCSLGSKIFDFILIISGLDDIPADKHRIEDHLVKAAVDIGKIDPPNEKIDTKVTWKTLSESQKSEILNKLKESKSFSRKIFPQHFKGLGC
ncbi:MAG: hypothetical protein DRO98_04890 [Archaeoglobales archaeon]|nr:MAG: hypothetical protein DRO98_04890 [Archaeoglobales archaeon]